MKSTRFREIHARFDGSISKGSSARMEIGKLIDVDAWQGKVRLLA